MPRATVKPKLSIVFAPKPVNTIQEEVLVIFDKEGHIKNGELVGKVVRNSTDKQYRISVLRTVFDMKQVGLIEEYNVNGIVWVRKK